DVVGGRSAQQTPNRQLPPDALSAGGGLATWSDPGRAHAQRQEAGALQALAAPPPSQVHAGALACGQGQLLERAGLLAVARPWPSASPLIRRRGGGELV